MLVSLVKKTVPLAIVKNGLCLRAGLLPNSDGFVATKQHRTYRTLSMRPSPLPSSLRQVRHLSATEEPDKPEEAKVPPQPNYLFDPESLYIVSIPITTHRSYIFCNHKPSFLEKRKNVPVYVKVETKLTGWVRKGWDKLRKSDNYINKKVVELANKLLNTIPYDESCLSSFPAKKVMVRDINEEHRKHSQTRLITGAMEEENVSVDQLKPIPLYHPRFQEASAILSQLHNFKDQFGAFHKKWAIGCAVGIPITLPLALIPVMPNVPGFYLAYRLYCHIRALRGINNLKYLLESKGHAETEPHPEDTTHLTFQPCPSLDIPYLGDATFAKVKAEDSNDNEQALLTHDTIDQIVKHTGLINLKDDLHKALRQETDRLQKQLAEENIQ